MEEKTRFGKTEQAGTQGRPGQAGHAGRTWGFCLPAPSWDLRQVTRPLSASHSLVAVIGQLFVMWVTTQHPWGHHSLRVITRLPTPTFCVGWAVTFHLIFLNQITYVCQKCSFQKGFWAMSEDIQRHRVSHTNLFSFRSICCFLLCWIVVSSLA